MILLYNNSLVPVIYPAYLNLVSNAIAFLDLKIILHSSRSLDIDLHDKCKNFLLNVNIFINFITC